jgi:hypothetical protein
MATVYFGSNKKPLEMLLDTGAASSWVMGSSCKDAACTRHDTYGPSDSTAYNATGDTFEVKYGTGVVKGSWIQDDVTFADMAVSFSFGVADEVSDHFSNFPMDGILGLAQNAGLAPPTFLATLVSNKVLQSNIFAVNLHRSSDGTNDGEITFGSVDQSKFVGDITYTPIVKPGGSWIIKSEDAGVGGKKAGLVGKDVVIDTGTSYVFLPPADAKLFYATMEGAFEDAAGGSYSVPCDTTQTAQFTFGGVTYEVSPKDWIGGSTGKGSYCTSNIYSRDATGMNMWLMGDTFLKNVYSVFDVDQNRIGMLPTIQKLYNPAILILSGFAKKPSGPVPTSTSGSSSTTSIGGQALLSSQGVPFPGRPDPTILVSSVSSPQLTYSDMYSEASSSPSPTLPSSTTNIATSSVETSNEPSITESSSSDSSQTTSPPSTTMLPGSQGFEAVITSGTTVTTEETTAPAPPPPSEVQPDAPATTTADGAASSISICLTAYSVVIFAAFAAIL